MKLKFTVTERLDATTIPFIREIGRRAALGVMEEIQTEVQANIHGRILRVRTGGLTMAWSVRPEVEELLDGDFAEAILRVNSKYARIHEEGGTIVPNPSSPTYTGWLHFRVEDGGWVKVKKVKMPATKYVTQAFEAVNSRVDGILDRVFRETKNHTAGNAP